MKSMANKGSATKTIKLIVALILFIVMVATVISFSWFRNTIDVTGVDMQTGSFQYQFIGYHVDASSSDLRVDFAYSTQASEDDSFDIETGKGYNPILQDGTLTAVTDHTSITNSIEKPGEIYYVIRKLDPSVALDVSLSIDADLENLKEFSGSGNSLEAIGGFYYSIVDITGTAASRDIIETAIKESTIFQMSDGEVKQERTEEYFPDIRNEFVTDTLEDSNEYLCFRLCYGIKQDANTSAYAGKTVNISVNLCVAQKGGLEGDESSAGQHYVRTLQQLKDALLVYKPNDTIIIQENITYEGDLIVNRPLKLHIVGSTLTVKGNMRLNYDSRGSFIINTSLAGQLLVQQMDDVDAGGNLYFDLPNSSIELIGQNIAEGTSADIAVQNVFSVDVDYVNGLIVTRSRICDLENNLKTIYLRNESTIDIFARTSVGTITVHSDAKASTRAVRIHIVNKGTIEEINLVNMGYVSGAFDNPRIFIDNYGNIERDGSPTPIKLPIWSCKWYEDVAGGRDKSNTRIIHQQGAGFMSVGSSGHSFISDGSGVESRDHIEYAKKESLVDKDPDTTHITVHYIDNDIFVQKDDQGTVVTDRTSLQNIIEHYLPDGQADDDYKIAELEDIVSLKILCYGKYSLTPEDYAFIATMKGLEFIDLSEAVSAEDGANGRTVPDNAFAGLSKLKELIMSDLDNAWGTNLFEGTMLDEIRFPTALKTLSAASLTGIKYLHIGNKADLIINFIPNYNTEYYIFCTDEKAREALILDIENGAAERFKEKTGSAPKKEDLDKISKIFLEAERHGNYFVNLYDNTCFISTYVGDFNAENEKNGYHIIDNNGEEVYYQFDFETLRIGNEIYQVAGYDDFAFYEHSLAALRSDTLKFSENLSSIGDYAFYSTSLPANIDLGGCKMLGHGALASNSVVRVLKGNNVETLGFWACGDLKAIEFIYLPCSTWNYGAPFGGQSSSYPTRLDIGLLQTAADAIDKTSTGYHKLYSTKTHDANTTLFVHSEYMTSGIEALTPYTKKPYRAFASENVLALLTAAGCSGVSSLGEYTPDDVLFLADQGLEFGAYAYLPIAGTSDYELISYMNRSTVDFNGEDYEIPAYRDENGNVYNTTKIRGSAFYYATFINVDTLTFADSYELIGNSAFQTRSKTYTKLDLNNVKTVESYAFNSSPAITVIGNNVTTLSNDTFNKAKNLVTASFKNVTKVGTAFSGCTSLRMATVGPITGDGTFSACTALELLFVNVTGVTQAPGTSYLKGKNTNVDFTVVSIGGEFSWELSPNSPNVAGVETPYNLITIEDGIDNIIFSDWTTETIMTNGIATTLYFPSFMYAKQTDNANELSLIMSFEFEYVSADSYILPDNIYRISGTENVTTILGNSVPQYTCIATTDGTREDTGMHVTHIGDGAFKNLLTVSGITFPHSLEYIGKSAFENCVFGDVVLNGKGTLVIDEKAFYDATMTSLTINGTKKIGKQAFANIDAPTDSALITSIPVQLGSVLSEIGERAFEGAKIASITSTHNSAYNIELEIGEYAFFGMSGGSSGEISVDFAGAYVLIGEYAFSGVSFSDVIMPNMRLISSYAFSQSNISGTLDLSGSGNGMDPTIMPLAFVGVSNKKMIIGEILLGNGTQLKGDFRIKGGAISGKDGTQEYLGAFTDCTIGTIDFGNAVQPEALSFVRCSFSNMYFGEMKALSVNVTGPGVINYSLSANTSIDHPYMVDKNGNRVDNTAWTKFIFRDCSGYGNVYLENIVTVGGYAFGTNATTTINSIDFGAVTHLDTYAFRNIKFLSDLVFTQGVTLSAQAFQGGTVTGDVFFADGMSFTSYSFITMNFEGTLSFGSFTSSTSESGSIFTSKTHYGRTIEKIVFRPSCTSIPAYSFAMMIINEIDFANIKTIGKKAFADSTLVKILNMDSITSIGESAFGRMNPSRLVPAIGSGFDISNVTNIGSYAFDCNTINDYIDISNVSTFGTAIFRNAVINADVNLGNITVIPENMFEGTKVTGTIGLSKIVEISANAFLNATLSQDLVFDRTITIIENAFNGATIPTVTFLGGGTISQRAFANSNIGVLKLGAISSIAGATPTMADDGTVSGDDTGAFYKATIGEIRIENAADPEPLSFAYATIGVLDYGNLTQTGVTSGADSNGFSSPFYKVDKIDRINFGMINILGDYYFKDVEITRIDTVESMQIVGDYAFRNCTIYNAVTFSSLVELRPRAFDSTSIYHGLKFESGITSVNKSEGGSLIYYSTIVDGDLYIKEIVGTNWYNNKYIMDHSTVGGAFTIAQGAIRGAFQYNNFNGDFNIENVTAISSGGNGAFLYNNFADKSIVLDALLSVSRYSFYSCKFQTGTTIYINSATSIMNEAFQASTGFETVIAPVATSIGTNSFKNCSSLKSIYIPKVKTIGAGAFASCISLKTLSLPSIVSFTGGASGAYSFVYQCSSLEKIVFGESFTSWGGNGALISTVSSLTQIVIMSDPNNITGVSFGLPSGAMILVPSKYQDDYSALIEADSDGKLWGSVTLSKIQTVEKLLIDGDITYLAVSVGDESDKKIELIGIADFGASSITNIFTFPSELGEYTVVSIADGAMKSLRSKGIETIVLPATLEYINFSGSSVPATVTSYNIAESNAVYKTVDGILYSKDGKTIVLCPVGASGEITLDGGVTVIGQNAFAGCEFITKIVIAQQVLITDGAFAHCSNLNEIVFTSQTPSIFIGKNIIDECSDSLLIKVPAEALSQYLYSVYYDSAVSDRIVSAS